MPKTQHWITEINRATDAFHSEFGSLSQEQLNWKPNAGTWSIAQNIDHLIHINASYFPVVKEVREGGYAPPLLSKIGFIPKMLGNMILQSTQPDRKRKVSTFPVWEPAESNLPATILEDFAQSQEALKQLIRESEDLLNKGAIIYSPANRKIFYKLETGFDIITVHEWRHLEQAKEVKHLLQQ